MKNQLIKIIRVGWLVLMFSFLFISSQVYAETIDKIVAKVGSEVITMTDIAQEVAQQRSFLVQKYGQKKGLIEFNKFKKNALNEMILAVILKDQIKKKSIEVTEAELQNEYHTRLKQNGISERKLMEKLSREGVSLRDFKEQIKQDMERQRFVQKNIIPSINVSDYDLQKEYEKNKKDYQVYTKLKFIEVFLTQDKFKTPDELVKVAKKIQSTLKRGASATSLIKKYSSGAFASKGGLSGNVDSKQLRPEIQSILSRLKKGETSEPISVGAGVFVFKLLNKSNPVPLPFNQVANQIRTKVGEQFIEAKMREYLMAIKDQTYVEIVK